MSCSVFTEWTPAAPQGAAYPLCSAGLDWADWAESGCPWPTGWRRTGARCRSAELQTASQSSAGCLLKLETENKKASVEE